MNDEDGLIHELEGLMGYLYVHSMDASAIGYAIQRIRRCAELEAEKATLKNRVEMAYQVATANVNKIRELYPRAQCNPTLDEVIGRQQVWKSVWDILNSDLTMPEVEDV